MGFLQRLQFHRDIFKRKKISFERKPLFRQAFDDQLARFGVDRLRLPRILTVKRDLSRRRAPAETYL